MRKSHFRILTAIFCTGLATAVWFWGGELFPFSSAEQQALAELKERTPLRFEPDDKGAVVKLTANTESMTDELAGKLLRFPHLRKLHLERSGITDKALAQIGRLDNLDELYLDETKVTDQGLAELESLSGLKVLSLAGCEVTDQGLESVARHSQLQLLSLANTGVTDAGLPKLRRLSQLENLYLKGLNLEGAGLLQLQQLTALKKLDLSENPLTRKVIPLFSRLEQLEHLYLTKCPVGDEFVAEFIPVLVDATPSLRSFSLADSQLTDDAVEPLKQLAELKQLAVVQLQGTAVTKSAFKRLATAVPDVNFSVNYSESE